MYTSIPLFPETRDRVYKLKFRMSYDDFINELCDKYCQDNGGEA